MDDLVPSAPSLITQGLLVVYQRSMPGLCSISDTDQPIERLHKHDSKKIRLSKQVTPKKNKNRTEMSGL